MDVIASDLAELFRVNPQSEKDLTIIVQKRKIEEMEIVIRNQDAEILNK